MPLLILPAQLAAADALTPAFYTALAPAIRVQERSLSLPLARAGVFFYMEPSFAQSH